MDKLPALNGFNLELPAERRPQPISLFLHTHRQTPQLLELAAYLGLRGPLLVLDGGNCFNTYQVAAALYRMAPYAAGQRQAAIRAILERIRAARAFTCFQMAALIHQALNPPTPSARMIDEPRGIPVLALEFLTTFLDENTPLGERQRLLAGCLLDLKKLAQAAPVLITVRQSSTQPIPPEMMAALEAAAGEIWRAEPPPTAPTQLPLFGV